MATYISYISLVRRAVWSEVAITLTRMTPGRTMVLISSHELLHEVSDDARFRKDIRGPLSQVRNATGDGLFTVSNSFTRDGLQTISLCVGQLPR